MKLTDFLKGTNFTGIHRAAVLGLGLALAANATEPAHTRPATPEDILEMLHAMGAKAEITRNPVTGEIDAIQGKLFSTTEWDKDDLAGVIGEVQAAGLPQKITGDLAQTSVTTTVNATCSTTSSSTSVTFTDATGIVKGAAIVGTGIPTGTTLLNLVGTTGTLSAAATATGAAVAVVITAETQVIGLGDWTLDWKRKTVDATTTDDATYESSLPSTASWSIKAKYMFIVGDTSQSSNILAAITAPQTPQMWNFFPTIGVGLPVYSGYAYVDGITMAAGSGKLVSLDCSLKGTGYLNAGTQLAPATTTNTQTGKQGEV